MTNPVPDLRPAATDQTPRIKRRGLLGALGALAAGVVAKLTEAPLSAGTDGDVVLGGPNTTTTTTSIARTGMGSVLSLSGEVGTVLLAINNSRGAPSDGINGRGVWGVVGVATDATARGIGVKAESAGEATGVVATSDSGRAVWATTARGFGVVGRTLEAGIAVMGESIGSGYPILGWLRNSSFSQSSAMFGLNESRYGEGSAGAGGFGLYGLSLNGHGIVGATTARGAAGIVGATNGVAGTAAAAFFGQVFVRGDFTVAGGAKSAAVPHPDGTHRRLYCVESPESWFEDFGRGRLECGRAEVMLDPDFAALVDLSDYHVFLTEKGTHHHVIVKSQTPTGFTVEADAEIAALKGQALADLNGTFSWRVVAKRKDIDGERLATVVIPTAPTLPEAPAPAPPMPEMPRQQVR